jgi:hypothetical protein
MASVNKVTAFATKGVKPQARDSSQQAVGTLANAKKSMNTTLVADSRAGTKQIAPEDAHPNVVSKLKLQVALNLHKILAKELEGIAKTDYKALEDLISVLADSIPDNSENYMQDAIERLKASRGQIADVIATNAVHMETGNTVSFQSANDIRILKSLLWRAGTAMRFEAPVMVDNAHSRIMLAHMMLQEADMLAQRAQNIITTVKDEFGLTAKDIALVATDKIALSAKKDISITTDEDLLVSADQATTAATTKVKVHSDGTVEITSNGNTNIIASGNITLKGSSVNINPAVAPTTTSASPTDAITSAGLPEVQSKGKRHLELAQWEGMSPIPAFITDQDEIKLQEAE